MVYRLSGYQKRRKWGSRGHSVHKVLASQPWGPEFNPPNPILQTRHGHVLAFPMLKEAGMGASLGLYGNLASQ